MFEESKIWGSLFALFVVVSICFCAQYLTSVDAANTALRESEANLVALKEQLYQRRKYWNEKEQVVQQIQAESEKSADLLETQEILDQRFRKADSDLKYALETMVSAVERTRNNAPGTSLAELTLANGKVLRDVKIRKVDDAGISFIHSDGVGNIPSAQAPENLKEQYDLGQNALVPMIQKAQAALLQKPENENINNPTILPPEIVVTTPSKPSSTSAIVDDSKAKRIRLRIAELDSLIASYAPMVDKYRTSAASHQALARSAKERGTPTSRHTDNANKILAQANALEIQLASMREERAKLVVELEYALRGK